MSIIYFLIAFFATFVGSMTGAAGGIIMKPIIDFIGEYDAITIGLLCGITLIFMGVVNVSSHIIKKTEIRKKIAVYITIGSVVGGIIGGKILTVLNSSINNDGIIKIVQNILLIIFMLSSLYYVKNKDRLGSFKIDNSFVILIIGLSLGIISTFLGIGGGPINVSAMILFMSLSTKESAVYSIITVIFAQSAKMITFSLEHSLLNYDIHVLPFMVVAGILGGWLGAKFNKKMSENILVFVFNAIQLGVVVMCCVNIFTNIYCI